MVKIKISQLEDKKSHDIDYTSENGKDTEYSVITGRYASQAWPRKHCLCMQGLV